MVNFLSAPGQQTELRDIKTRVVLGGDQSTRVTLRTLHQNNLPPPKGNCVPNAYNETNVAKVTIVQCMVP